MQSDFIIGCHERVRRRRTSRMAEREGFEPSRRLPAYPLSKRAHSATMRPLRLYPSKLQWRMDSWISKRSEEFLTSIFEVSLNYFLEEVFFSFFFSTLLTFSIFFASVSVFSILLSADCELESVDCLTLSGFFSVRRQLVQIWTFTPPNLFETKFGRNLRFVRRFECETFCPETGRLPQRLQTLLILKC